MPPKKAAKGYKFPNPLSKGDILTDMRKKKWIVGPTIGRGGFGEIYCAADAENIPSKVLAYGYVIKLEPQENGPLFVEQHFYIRVAKEEDILEWMKQKKLSSFGLSPCYGSGSHDVKGVKHRFLVMQRYGQDLWTIFLEHHRIFPLPVVLRVGIQVLDVLEYIHSKNYVHADIKGANLLLGLKKGSESQVFVVDFGLSSKYNTSGEYKRDPRRAHNGTPEYTSRDAHMGVPTRRGDLEILAYNMVHWLTSKLPWESIIENSPALEEAKIKAMNNVPAFLKTCFDKKPVPEPITKFVSYVASMEPFDVPDYSKVRAIFTSGVKACGGRLDGPLDFGKGMNEEEENAVPTNDDRRKASPRKGGKSVADAKSGEPPKKRGRPRKRDDQDDIPDLASDVSDEVRNAKKTKAAEDGDNATKVRRGRRPANSVKYNDDSSNESSPMRQETKTSKQQKNASPVLKARHPNFFMQAGVYQRQTK